jgi:hypothetical protein
LESVRTIGLFLLFAGAAGSALAGGVATVPEIDAPSAIGAVALFSGALLVIRGRRKDG